MRTGRTSSTSRSLLKRGLKKYAPGAFSDEDIDRILRWTVREVDLVNEYLQIRSEADDMDAEDVKRVQDEVFLDDEDDPLLLRLCSCVSGLSPTAEPEASRCGTATSSSTRRRIYLRSKCASSWTARPPSGR